MAGTQFRNVGTHAFEVVVSAKDGDKVVMLGPGEFIELSAEDQKNEHNVSVMDDLLEVEKGGK